VLIRGASGSGKSRLALGLIQAAERGDLRFARLVADDRAHVEASHGRLLVRPAPALAGMIEVRGLGIRHLPYEPVARVGLLIDLGDADAERMPQDSNMQAEIDGIVLPRLSASASMEPVPVVLGYLQTRGNP
jgi:HPr kinase/phosphorylase